ncbi:MAG TPA: HEAT repeat domain-containing protein, partial [Gemmata sp.]
VPALAAALEDRAFEVRFAAARALIHITTRPHTERRATIAVFVEGCRNKDNQVRTEAAQYLGALGTAARAAVPVLNELLKAEAPGVKTAAAYALVEIAPAGAAGAVPVLVEVLATSPDSGADYERAHAAKALGALGPVAKAAGPELVKQFGAKNPHVRVGAAAAAMHIDAALTPKAVAALVELLRDSKYKRNVIRLHALNALAGAGAGAKRAMPALVPLLTDDGRYHEDVALAAVAIDPQSAKSAFEWIRKELSAPNPDPDLIERLPALGARAAALTPDLTSLLKSRRPDVRQQAVKALGAIGPGARGALPALKKLAETDPEPQNRTDAAAAVKNIEAK